MLQKPDAQPHAFMRAFDNPGRSATTNVRPNPGALAPSGSFRARRRTRGDHSQVRLECREGYSAIFGRAAEMREISVDLPAFGNPTSPTSARNLNSSRRWVLARGPSSAPVEPGAMAWRNADCRVRPSAAGHGQTLARQGQIGQLLARSLRRKLQSPEGPPAPYRRPNIPCNSSLRHVAPARREIRG